MADWKNQQDIKRKLDEELLGLVADEKGFGEILLRAGRNEVKENWEKNKEISGEMKGEIRMTRGNKKNRSVKTMFKAAVIAAAITVVSVGTVFGYEYLQRMYTQVNPFDDPLGNALENAPVYSVEQQGVNGEGANNEGVNHTANNVGNDSEANNDAIDSNIMVEWEKYAVTEHSAIFTVKVQSKDGSPILCEEENKVPIHTTMCFDRIEATIDGKTEVYLKNGISGTISSGWGQKGMEVAEDLSNVTIQLEYFNNDVSFPGKDILLKLEGFSVEYFTFESIDAKDSLGNLLVNGTEAKKEDFVPCEGSVDYNLEPGANTIYFSDMYPECYIDNFGFAGRKSDGTMKFYMTVVCDDASKEDLKKMTFQSSITGWDEGHGVKELADGRIQYSYTVNSDNAYWHLHDGGKNVLDTTMEHVSTLVLKKNSVRVWEKDAEGTWEKVITLTDSAESICENIDVFVPGIEKESCGFTAKEVIVDSMKVKINGSCLEDFDFQYFGFGGENYPVVILKDGTRILANGKGVESRASANTISGEVELSCVFKTVIDVSQVVAVEFHGVTLWEAE